MLPMHLMRSYLAIYQGNTEMDSIFTEARRGGFRGVPPLMARQHRRAQKNEEHRYGQRRCRGVYTDYHGRKSELAYT